jgi:hypothetical protein
MPDKDDTIKVHERLARIEAVLEGIVQTLQAQEKCDEKQDVKLDKILENDKDKLQRITKAETTIKNIKASLYIFSVALVGAVVKSFT